MFTKEQAVDSGPEVKGPHPKEKKDAPGLGGNAKSAMEAQLGIALSGFVPPEEAAANLYAETEKGRIASVLELQRNQGNYYVQQAIASYQKKTGAATPLKVEPSQPKTTDQETVPPEKKGKAEDKLKPPATTDKQKKAEPSAGTDKAAAPKPSTPESKHPPQVPPPKTAEQKKTAEDKPGPKLGTAAMFENKVSPGSKKPAAGKAGADGATGGGKGGDPVNEWRGKVEAKKAGIKPTKVTVGGGESLKTAADKSAAERDDKAKKLPDEGDKAITPPKPVEGLPAIPDDVSKTALKLVDQKLGLKFDSQTLPDLAKESPLHHIPIIGKEFVPTVVPTDPAKKDEAEDKKDETGKKKDEKKEEKKTEPPQPTDADKEAEKKKLSRTGATVKDEAPPAVDVPEGKKVDIGSVVARLIAEEGAQSKKIVDDSRAAAFPGVADDVKSKFGPELNDEEIGIVDAELRRVAEAAGVEKTELNKKVEDRRKELADQKKDVEEDRSKSLEEARNKQEESSKAFLGVINDVRDQMDRSASARAGMVKGSVDAEKIRAEREQLIDKVNRNVGNGNVSYETSAKKLKAGLDAEVAKQVKAYQVAAAEDREQLNKDADTDDKKKAAMVAYRTTKYWVDEQTAALHKAVEIDKVAIDTQLDTFKKDLKAGAKEARDKIRDWAAQRLGYERSFFQRLFDLISDWLSKSKIESEAWAKQRADDNNASVNKDANFLDTEVAKLSKMTQDEVNKELATLTDEQFAIVKAYFEGGGDALGVLANRLMARIAAQQKPELVKKLDEAVLASSNFEDVNAVAVGRNPGFKSQARLKADNLYKAFKGPGTNEDGVFAALGGLTAIEGRAVELIYNQTWGKDDEDLKTRLKSELDDWATFTSHDIDRANAMLAGNDAEAVAVQLDQAMHGTMLGTGLGTDEDTIFAALRNKSPSEIAAIKKAYKEKYGKELQGQLEGELNDWFVRGTHDVDRMNALMNSDSESADVIAIDQAMHGGWLGLGLGTDRKGIEDVYAQQQAELEQQAAAKGWDSAKLKQEIDNLHARIGLKYKDKYKVDLGDAYNDELSGSELRLITGLQEQDLAKVSAAKIDIEHHSVFYADDKIINKAVQDQYSTEFVNKKRDLNLALDEEMEADKAAFLANKDEQGYYKKWTPEEIRKRRKEVDKKAEEDAKEAGAKNFDKMEKEYDTQYKGKFTVSGILTSTPSQGLRKDILNDTQFTQNEKAKKLIGQKGYLSDIQETRYAIQGLGTDDDKMKEVTKGKSSADMADLRKRWAEDPENKALGIKEDLDTFVLGDYSGREKKDMELTLKYGDEPDNPDDQLAKAKELQAYEKDALMSHIIAGRELDVMDQDVANLEKEVNTFQTYAAKKNDKDFDWKKYADLKGNVDSQMTIVESSVSVHRQSVDVISDTVAQVIGAVVTAVIIVVSIVADVVTVGGAAAATPAEGAAIGALWSALGISLGGTALTMASKALIKGTAAYGWEEVGLDAGIGLVDALLSALTAGTAGKILKGSPFLLKMAERKALGKIVANFIAHAAEGALQSAPGALLGAAANKQNYKDGNAILNILEGAAVQVGGAALMSGGMATFHGMLKENMLMRARTDPEFQERVFERYVAENAKKGQVKTRADFLANLDSLIATQTTLGFKDPKMQEQLRARVLEHIPPEQHALFKDVPVRVMSAEEFKAYTKSDSGNAVAIFHDGKPTVVLKAGTDLSELGAEGVHLMQSKDPATAAKVKKLDESVLQHWDKLDFDTQMDLYKTKLELEVDAHERQIRAMEEQKQQAGGKNAEKLDEQIKKAQANLENLKKRQVEVDAISPEDREAMETGKEAKPQYLDQPARLFSKDPKLAVPEVEPEPKLRPVEEVHKELEALKQVESQGPLNEDQQARRKILEQEMGNRPIESIRKEYDALKQAQSREPLNPEQQARLQSFERELASHYSARPGESLEQMEKRLLGQRPKETLAEYHERLAKLNAEVERGGNVELWMRYEELLGEVKTEIGQETVLSDKLEKAQKAARDADRALSRQRRARNDPRIQIPEDERVTTRQRDELEAAARQLQDELKALQNRHRRQPWKDISLNDPDVRRVGLFGELEMTVKAQEMGVQRAGRTVPPELIATPQELDAQFNKYKGQHGMDGIYTRPDPAHAGEEEFFVGESKTSGDPSPRAPSGKGELATTKGGLDQLSDDWIRSNLDKAGLTDEQRARFEDALKNKRVRKFYAQTDKTGTHFYEVIDISSKEVRIGAKITSF
ncbi:MAG: hypothetical protein ACJ71W_11790 [Terriglobales bacterium]